MVTKYRQCWLVASLGRYNHLLSVVLTADLKTFVNSRLMFHPGVKEHSLPANTRTKEGWRYLGSRAELLIIAENLQPDGTYQPWLHPEWNKFF